MEKKIYDEKNGLWYELQGDYYLPCLSLPKEEQKPVGVWGQRHLRYIKEHKRAFYTNLLISCTQTPQPGRAGSGAEAPGSS